MKRINGGNQKTTIVDNTLKVKIGWKVHNRKRKNKLLIARKKWILSMVRHAVCCS